MKPIKRVLLVALLVAVAVVGTGASPAAAHNGVCVGQGHALTGAGLVYPGVSLTGTTTNSLFNLEFGACVTSGGVTLAPPAFVFATVTVTGLVTGGFCGHSIGIHGVMAGHHTFGSTSSGSVMVIHNVVNQRTVPPTVAVGETAVGVAQVAPDTFNGESCATFPGADRFVLSGAVQLIS